MTAVHERRLLTETSHMSIRISRLTPRSILCLSCVLSFKELVILEATSNRPVVEVEAGQPQLSPGVSTMRMEPAYPGVSSIPFPSTLSAAISASLGKVWKLFNSDLCCFGTVLSVNLT
jgi:hypothetical protein